jgi:hypothetical protein
MSDLLKAYSVLGLEPGSPKDAIQSRYKRLVLVWHPDRFPTNEGKADAEEELKKIVNAKELLVKHFDSGKHKGSGCACSQAGGAASSGKNATAARSSASNERAAAMDAMDHGGAGPSADQLQRWTRAERAFENELKKDEREIEKKAVEWYLSSKAKEDQMPRRQRRSPRSRKKTLQDQLDQASGKTRTNDPLDDSTLQAGMQLFDDWRSAIASPIEFFETMPIEGGLAEPVTFYASIAAINSVAWFLVEIAHPQIALVHASIYFVALMAIGFILAGITNWFSKLLGGNGSFEASYRAVAYSFAPNVVLWIPILQFFAWLYAVFLFRLALGYAQELKSARATAIVAVEVFVPGTIAAVLFFSGLINAFKALWVVQ